MGPVPEGQPKDLYISQIQCCLCGLEGVPLGNTSGFSFLCKVKGVNTFSKCSFSLYRCDKCGIGITFPQVAARYISLLYENSDAIPFLREEGGIVNKVRKIFFLREARYWLKWIGKKGHLSEEGRHSVC